MKVFISLIAIFIGLIGLLMTACGVIFAGMGMMNPGGLAILGYAVPSIVVGVVVGWVALKVWQSQRPPKPPPGPAP
jgi:LytS/YehU family sensor histidine kinase